MHFVLIVIHNLLRWAVIFMMVLVLIRAYRGLITRSQWSSTDKRLQLISTILLDSQVLIGVVMYIFTSPLTRVIFSDFNSVLMNPTLRFFSVEHIIVMALALICVHVGNSKSKNADSARQKYRHAAIWFTLSLLLLLLGIPWPFSTYSRP